MRPLPCGSAESPVTFGKGEFRDILYLGKCLEVWIRSAEEVSSKIIS